jgi:histone acetyltransferase (RNA polymerase elongator complex component)
MRDAPKTRRSHIVSECKHGMKSGCVYCHGHVKPTPEAGRAPKKRGKPARLSEQMNDRMTDLKRRLKKLRDQPSDA